jgi:hypothetical protein
MGLLFNHGEMTRKIQESEMADMLVAEVEAMVLEKKNGKKEKKHAK